MDSAFSSFFVLVLVVAAIPAVLWAVARLARLPARSNRALTLGASLALGARERVAVVRVGERWLVLGVTAGGITLLRELDKDPGALVDPDSAASNPHGTPGSTSTTVSARGGFAEVFARLRGPGAALLVAVSLGLGLALWPDAPAHAQQGLLNLNSTTNGSGTTWSVPIQTLLTFTALSFLPAVLLLMTSFTRIVIVLSLVRQALGLQAAPPNQVIVGMALFMTAFIMAPTLDKVYRDAYQPFAEQRIDFDAALAAGATPMRTFMLAQTRSADLGMFVRIAKIPPESEEASDPAKVPFRVLVPAFVISELKTAFQIGFMVFIPFILIDLICASVLMSLGMMMVSPVLVALPFKLVLFVLADGWNLLVGSLVSSFST